MKRTMPWSDDDEDSSDDESSDSQDNNETGKEKSKGKPREQKSRAIDFEALKRHGFKGGPSVLNVPPPKEGHDLEQDWSWSTGKERREDKEAEESYEERQKTRVAISLGEQLPTVQTQKEKKVSFSQKEKRKRELGQASRGKNYVEEEKRLLRDRGVYSGFDT